LDEASLIRPCIDHLRSIGVDEFIVCDMGSTDGTAEILRSEEGKNFKILWSCNEEMGDVWLQRNTEAVANSRARWVVMLDADEFPLPAKGDLRRVLASMNAEIIKVPRFNVVRGPTGLHMPMRPTPEDYASVDLYVQNERSFRNRLIEERLNGDTSFYWLRYVPLPKVIFRPSVLAQLKFGMHDIIARKDMMARRELASNIVTAHVALSDYDRFARKLENVRNMFQLHEGQLPQTFAWHWRRWVELANRGQLREEYDRSVLSHARIAALRANGTICSAASILIKGNDAEHL
jgi:glycosyltransferase involved in cell wall biosynthesis